MELKKLILNLMIKEFFLMKMKKKRRMATNIYTVRNKRKNKMNFNTNHRRIRLKILKPKHILVPQILMLSLKT